MQQIVRALLALDIGEARTGVAIMRSVARIASPLTVITDQAALPVEVAKLVQEHDAVGIVLGLPRNLRGESTAQTAYVESVAERLAATVTVPLYFVDEAGTSVKAEQELRSRRKPYEKADIDMLAATYILEDFAEQHPEVLRNVAE